MLAMSRNSHTSGDKNIPEPVMNSLKDPFPTDEMLHPLGDVVSKINGGPSRILDHHTSLQNDGMGKTKKSMSLSQGYQTPRLSPFQLG